MFDWDKNDPDVFHIKQGNLLPSLSGYAEPAALVDLTGATITFSMVSEAGNVIIQDAAASAVVLTVAPEVSYAWASGQTDKHGKFEAEFTASYGAVPLSIPNFERIKIFIDKRIGG